MRELSFSSSAFPTASCETCGTIVLTHVAISEGGVIGRRCVRCDRPITAELAWWSVDELEQHGYQVEMPRRARAKGEIGGGGGCGGGCACSAKKLQGTNRN
jgi:hypothetical protein